MRKRRGADQERSLRCGRDDRATQRRRERRRQDAGATRFEKNKARKERPERPPSPTSRRVGLPKHLKLVRNSTGGPPTLGLAYGLASAGGTAGGGKSTPASIAGTRSV